MMTGEYNAKDVDLDSNPDELDEIRGSDLLCNVERDPTVALTCSRRRISLVA